MSTLSDALAAMDKATPEEWTATERFDAETRTEAAVWGPDSDMVCMVYPGYEGDEWIEAVDRAKKIAAAPDALAWIKEALPWLEAYKHSNEFKTCADPQCLVCRENIARLAILDALIARAKPEEVGR